MKNLGAVIVNKFGKRNGAIISYYVPAVKSLTTNNKYCVSI